MDQYRKRTRPMPQYAEYNTIHLSKSQFFHICKGRRPRFIIESGSDVVRIAKTKDGKYWAEWLGTKSLGCGESEPRRSNSLWRVSKCPIERFAGRPCSSLRSGSG
jgi:hypothetical protein